MKKNYKFTALLSIVLAMILVFSVTACDNNSENTNTSLKNNSTSVGGSSSDGGKPSGVSELDDFAELIEGGSYSGTDAKRGFPTIITRTNDTFNTEPEGYGAGTRGGRGATQDNTYIVTSGLELEQAFATISTKLLNNANLLSIIKIDGTITEANSTTFQIIANNLKNVSIIGTGAASVFDGVGLNFKSSDNIIVQNITIHHPSKTLKNEKDCLEFNNCRFIWVDHCEFYNDAPTSSSEKDYYDGLLDVKNESANVTVSYNYFHDAWKTSLVGSGPDDTYQGRTITYHHNKFVNCNSRMPAIRSGFGHLYNNYYNGIKSSGINCRIKAEVYVERNIFENTKKPICADEDSIIGSYNLKDNVFNGCSAVPNSSTTDFVPSYAYTLDATDGLKSYLEKTVGVGKINVDTAISAPNAFVPYTVPLSKLITRSIEELGTVSYTEECHEKLAYLAYQVSHADEKTLGEITNLQTLVNAISTYNELYAASLDGKIEAIDVNGCFSTNATLAYSISVELVTAGSYVEEHLTKKDILTSALTSLDDKFISSFNGELDSIKTNVSSSDKTALTNLSRLSERASTTQKAELNLTLLEDLTTKCDNTIAAEAFSARLNAMPSASAITAADKAKINDLKTAFSALTTAQLELVSTADKSAYQGLISAFEAASSSSRAIDLSTVTTGRKTEGAQIGNGIYVGINTDINNASAEYEGTSYEKAVYISGYGNKGSKCIQFSVLSASSISIVLNSDTKGAKFKITDENGVLVDSFIMVDGNITTVTKTLAEGEYRLFTDIPDDLSQVAKAYIYAFTITPTK